jgi:hypothetical protein
MVKKVVLAYSGGLDTSVILKWLQDTYQCEVITFTADIGQGGELEPARAKATQLGAREVFVDDLREEFVRDFVFPMFRANTIYEGEYLLGTSIARPLIAKRMVEIADEVGADAVAHGATGKGNDQVRFELGAYALNPDIKVIAPGGNGISTPGRSSWPTPSGMASRWSAMGKNPPIPWMPISSISATKAGSWKTPGRNPKPACGAGPRIRKRPPSSPATWKSPSPMAIPSPLTVKPSLQHSFLPI